MSPTSWYAILALLVVANLLLAKRLARKPSPRQPTPAGVRGLRLVIGGAWAYAVVPGLVQIFTEGRRDNLRLDESRAIGELTGVAIFLLTGVLIVTLVLVAGHSLPMNVPGAAGPATVLVLLAPWLVITTIALLDDQSLTPAVLIYPLIVISFWRIAPPLSLGSMLGGLVIVVAAGSLILGVFSTVATVTNAEFISKSFVSTTSVLAGPFTHPNQLGSFLALGLPSVLLLRNPYWRVAGVVCIATAVLWSASRTSLMTVVVVLAIYTISRRHHFGAHSRRAIAVGTTSLALMTMIALPLLIGSSSAFNERGQVWIASLSRWEENPLYGSGPLAYLEPGAYAAYLGPYAYHGHNMFVNVLAISGIAGIISLVPLAVLLLRRGVATFATGDLFAALFALSFMIDGILEVSTDFWKPGPTGVIVWISIALLAMSNRPAQRPKEATCTEGDGVLSGSPRPSELALTSAHGIQPRRIG